MFPVYTTVFAVLYLQQGPISLRLQCMVATNLQ